MALSRCLAGAAIAVAVTGCLAEKSVPLRHQDVVWITPPAEVAEGDGHDLSARQWVVHAHGELQRLLPPKGRTALVTEDLGDGHGHAVDVYAQLDKPKEHLKLLFKNFNALVHSTQAAAPGYAIESPAPPWAGFEDVWIPWPRGRAVRSAGLCPEAAHPSGGLHHSVAGDLGRQRCVAFAGFGDGPAR
jgi:hypothetical protein